MIITKTPLRISFGGGGTDISSAIQILQEPGAVVNLAINKYVYVFLKDHKSPFKEKYRLNYSKVENINSRSKIKNKIIKACLEYFDIKSGLYIGSTADIPAGTGLGSSSAFTIGLLHALHIYCGNQKITQFELAKEAVKIEVEILKSPIGIQDHYGCAIGGLKHFSIKNDNIFGMIDKEISQDELKWLTDRFLLFWTGKIREANTILKDQHLRIAQNKINLKMIKDSSFNFMRAYLNRDEIEIGKIIKNGWENKKKLSPSISNNKIEKIISDIENEGIKSVRLLGAGGGGFLLGWGKKLILQKLMKNTKLNFHTIKADVTGTKYFKF